MNRAVLAGVAALAMISGSGESRTRSGNRPVTEIHFDAVRGGMPFFPATVNAIGPFQFLLDTGGSGGHVDGEIAKRLGLKLERGTASVSGSANLDVGIIPEAMLTVGAARHRGQLLVSPLAPIEPILGRRFEGIIGGDFLQRYFVELNYDARSAALSDGRFSLRGSRPVAPAVVRAGHSVCQAGTVVGQRQSSRRRLSDRYRRRRNGDPRSQADCREGRPAGRSGVARKEGPAGSAARRAAQWLGASPSRLARIACPARSWRSRKTPRGCEPIRGR
jgi:Aspartyl protease